MSLYIKSLENIINHFRRLPGIGPKSAKRIVFYLLKLPKKEIRRFAESILDFQEKVKFCEICFNITENKICDICLDEKRDKSKICIVEEISDLFIIENTGEFRGYYHVLGGLLSPIDNIGPDELKIPKLLKRISENDIKEIIIALDPTVEGESTATYIKKSLKGADIKITTLASGIPVGGDLEYADEITLSRALSDRREI